MSANFSFNQVECSGGENSLEDCKHKNTAICEQEEGAGVVCIGIVKFQKSFVSELFNPKCTKEIIIMLEKHSYG